VKVCKEFRRGRTLAHSPIFFHVTSFAQHYSLPFCVVHRLLNTTKKSRDSQFSKELRTPIQYRSRDVHPATSHRQYFELHEVCSGTNHPVRSNACLIMTANKRCRGETARQEGKNLSQWPFISLKSPRPPCKQKKVPGNRQRGGTNTQLLKYPYSQPLLFACDPRQGTYLDGRTRTDSKGFSLVPILPTGGGYRVWVSRPRSRWAHMCSGIPLGWNLSTGARISEEWPSWRDIPTWTPRCYQ
jgi:hypothetical protein